MPWYDAPWFLYAVSVLLAISGLGLIVWLFFRKKDKKVKRTRAYGGLRHFDLGAELDERPGKLNQHSVLYPIDVIDRDKGEQPKVGQYGVVKRKPK